MRHLYNLGLILILLGFTTCVDPYEFGFDRKAEQSFVIEGYLTNIPDVHEIRVSRTTYIGEFNGVVADFVTNADVSIVDDQGGVIPLAYDDGGIYLTPPNTVAMPGVSYKVRVVMFNGQIFESSFESLSEELNVVNNIEYSPGTKEVLSENNVIVEEDGLNVNGNIKKSNSDKFYRLVMNHYFILESHLGPDFVSPSEQRGLIGEELRFCFIKDRAIQDLHLVSDLASSQAVGQTYQVDLEFVTVDNRFEHEFVIESTLLALPEKDFTYWSNIQKLAENTGGLFDAAPFSVIGNIRDISTESEKEVAGLGYFGVYNASVDREFITPRDLGISDPNIFPTCEIPPFNRRDPHPCEDCRLFDFYPENYENNPPTWWKF